MRRNPPAKWTLPLVVNPPTSTCWSVPVPDDPFHRAAFLGALQALGSAYKWQDDPEHTAKDVANVWRNIANDLERCQPPFIRVYESEDKMPFRVDCDCNVFAECCDGTEVQLATKADVQAPPQPGPTSPPGTGETKCSSFNLDANNLRLMPFTVSTGDIITIVGATGGWTDGTPAWFCPTGDGYVAGGCYSACAHLGGDPSGTACHMELIGVIAGSTIFALSDSPYTVPSGISNAQMVFQANDGSLGDNAGTISFQVCVASGSTPPPSEWCYLMDFTLFDYGGVARSGECINYVAGTGWDSTGCGSGSCGFVITFPGAAHVTKIEVYTQRSTGISSSMGLGYNDFTGGGCGSMPNGMTSGYVWEDCSDDQTGITGFAYDCNAGRGSGNEYQVAKAMIHGTGTNPFGTSNC